MADFLRLIDVNAGGLRQKRGQGILHLTFCSASISFSAAVGHEAGLADNEGLDESHATLQHVQRRAQHA